MKKRLFSLILAFALLIGLLPITASATEILPEPDQNEYRFNGHWVTDRGNFSLIHSDWTLDSFSESAAVITVGETAGTGMAYTGELPEKWNLHLSVDSAEDDLVGFILSDGNSQLSVTVEKSGGDALLTVIADSRVILENMLGSCPGTLRFVLDNCYEGQSLRLFLWHEECYLGGWNLTGLSAATETMLTGTGLIGFYAEQAGDIFTDFGVNTMIYAYENDFAAALAQVEAWAKQEVEGSIVEADNGVLMYTPDGVKNYDALWTRDFNYMLEYAGDYIPVENAVACIEYLLENVHEGDCWLPDRVYGNGKVNYAAGDMDYSRRNLDNNSFIVIALDCALSRMPEAEAKALFEKWESTLMTALDSLPKDENGLIYNDPLNYHSPYGFTDCICKTGSLMKESLLLWRAYGIMAKWQTAYGKDASVASAGVAGIESVLVDTFLNGDGMLNAATVDCRQSDIWGSCYAISIGFPMEESLKKSIADYLATNYDGLVQMGQIRHTAPGTYWQRLLSGINEGEYQNGAYWGTPTGWFIDALEPYYPELAMTTLEDIISYYAAEGIYECVNGDYRKLLHYAASASNILPQARRLLTRTPALEDLTLAGDTTAVKGATKTYSIAFAPTGAQLRSMTWNVNGNYAGNQETMTYTFNETGTYLISCVATDRNGITLTAEKNVTVTEANDPQMQLFVSGIKGKAGDTVTVSYSMNHGAALGAIELEITYDPAVMTLTENHPGTLLKAVFAAKDEQGTVRMILSENTPHDDAGTLCRLSFTLKQDVNDPIYLLPQVISSVADYKDDRPLGAADISVAENPMTEVEVKISHTVSFDSDLQMNYRIKLADILAAVPNYVTDGACLVVEKDRYPMGGGEKTVETVTLYPDLTTDAERMLFNLAGIQSVEMGSELRAVLHFFDAEGNEYYTTVDTYSVLAYAELCFDYYDPATDGYLFTMLIDCLNYGAAAQVAFDRRADELVNAGLEAYQQFATTELSAELTDVRTYVDNDRAITAVTAMGFSVTFADNTEINAKLTVADGYTKEDITSVKVLYENGEEVAFLTEFTELDDGRLQVTFTGVKSVNMRDMYYFVAYVGDQLASQNVGYSIEAYAKSNIASTDAGAAALAKACIYYGDSAKIYFDSLTK